MPLVKAQIDTLVNTTEGERLAQGAKESLVDYSWQELTEATFRGMSTEQTVKTMLSCFELKSLVQADCGSRLDVEAKADFIAIGIDSAYLFQVKSSEYGAVQFMENYPYIAKRRNIVWLESSSNMDRLLLFKDLQILFQGRINLRPEIARILDIVYKCKLIKRSWPMPKNARGQVIPGMSKGDINLLLFLGIGQLSNGNLILV